MELISRQAVLNGIDKYIEKAQSTGTKDDFISFAELGVKGLPSAFEGMTNREIISAFVERDDSFAIMVDEVNGTVSIELSLDFWNSLYQKGGK